MGTRLPSEEEVLIIRPTGKKGQPLIAPIGSALSVPGHLPGSRCIPKQDPNANAVQSECSLK
jgi:hypothetical protein